MGSWFSDFLLSRPSTRIELTELCIPVQFELVCSYLKLWECAYGRVLFLPFSPDHLLDLLGSKKNSDSQIFQAVSSHIINNFDPTPQGGFIYGNWSTLLATIYAIIHSEKQQSKTSWRWNIFIDKCLNGLQTISYRYQWIGILSFWKRKFFFFKHLSKLVRYFETDSLGNLYPKLFVFFRKSFT